MKCLSIVMVLAAALMLGGCGGGNSSSNSGSVNGNWTASLMSSASTSPVLTFSTTFTQTSGTSLNVTQFNFTTSSPCFVSGETETGGFVLSGNFNGSVTGALQMTIQSGNPSGNTLTLQGQVNNNAISGTWTLSGVSSGCTGSGSFTMTKM
jgi:hypothetical protein